jgi:hypothetical protein
VVDRVTSEAAFDVEMEKITFFTLYYFQGHQNGTPRAEIFPPNAYFPPLSQKNYEARKQNKLQLLFFRELC